jgi:hypothetical protein
MSEKVWARAGVIVYHIDPTTKKCSVLIGKESVFLKDKIEKLQLLNPDTGLLFTQ